MNQRLQELATKLRGVPDDRFNYKVWCNSREGLRVDCGSAGCALGWCTVFWPDSWEFKRSGDIGLVSGLCAFDAAADFFDISKQSADYLFFPHEGEYEFTANQVADKIQRFIDEHSTSESTV